MFYTHSYTGEDPVAARVYMVCVVTAMQTLRLWDANKKTTLAQFI